jgi:Flp pilus assembly protein TadG
MAQRTRRFQLPSFRTRLGRDERGTSLLEFGLFLPVLGLLVLGTMDLGRGLAVKFQLDQATQRTIELANLAGRPLTSYSFLIPEATAAAGVPSSQVTLRDWMECRPLTGAIRTNLPSTTVCNTGEQSARYITITIWKDYVPFFSSIPLIGKIGTGPNNAVRMTSDSGVRVQ